MKTTNWRPSTETGGGHWIVTRDTLRKAMTDRGREMAHGYVQKHKRGVDVVRFASYKEALAKADELNRTPDIPLCSCGVPGCRGVAPTPPPPRRRPWPVLSPTEISPTYSWGLDFADNNEN